LWDNKNNAKLMMEAPHNTQKNGQMWGAKGKPCQKNQRNDKVATEEESHLKEGRQELLLLGTTAQAKKTYEG